MNWDEERNRQVLDFFNKVTDPIQIVERIKDDPDYLRASGKAYGIRPRLAKKIIEKRNSLPKKSFTSVKQIDDIAGVGVDTLHDIYYSLTPPSQDFPVLLFPVRLETRFKDNYLLVRLYPDSASVNAHDPRLTADEVTIARRYNEEYARATTDAQKRSVWRGLVTKVGSRRAAYLKRLTGSDLDEIETKSDEWEHSPVLQLLPDHFLVCVYKDGVCKYSKRGNRVPSTLPIIANPANLTNHEDTLFDGESLWVADFASAEKAGMAVKIELPVGENGPFSRIVAIGMNKNTDPFSTQDALQHLLHSHRYTSGFSFVPYNTPSNNTGDTDSGYSADREDATGEYDVEYRRRSILDYDSMGKRTARALGIDGQTFQNVRYADAQEPGISEDVQTALWPALGDSFFAVLLNNRISREGRWLLWKHFARYVKARGEFAAVRVGKQPYGILPVTSLQDYEASSLDNIDPIRPELIGDISPGGQVFPRSGGKGMNIPSLWDFSDVPGFYNGFYRVLLQLYKRWLQIARDEELVPRIGKSGDTDQELMQVLSMQPVSVKPTIRALVDDRFVNWLLTYMGIDLLLEEMPPLGTTDNVLKVWGRALYETLRDSGVLLTDIAGELGIAPEQLTDSPAMKLFAWDEGADLPVPLVLDPGAEHPLSYLEQFTDPNTIPGLSAGKPLLYDLLRAALRYQKLEKAELRLQDYKFAVKELKAVKIDNYIIREIHVKKGDEVKKDAELIILASDGDKNALQQVLRAPEDCFIAEVHVSENDRVGLNQKLITCLGVVYADREVCKAVVNLKGSTLSPQEIEGPVRDVLDLHTHRLDAWLTSFATKRLSAMRSRPGYDHGLYIGAFGWTEDLTRDVRSLSGEPGGYIHAQSLAQAAAGAVLRNAYLTQKDNEEGNAYAINLNSKRVRKAWRLINGLKQGQGLGALLGYQFERGLHEAIKDKYIDEFRALYPVIGQTTSAQETTETEEAAEIVLPRNVVDGLTLVQDWTSYNNNEDKQKIKDKWSNKGIDPDNLDNDVEKELNNLIDTLDAFTDLLLYESTYHAVQGNYERSAAALDAMAGKIEPPEPFSVQSPPAGTPYTHRFCLLFNHSAHAFAGVREKAEPVLANWFSDVLGDMSLIACTARIYSQKDGDGNDCTPLDINTASQAELEALPELGRALAREIINDRKPAARGKFKDVTELTRIDGIGTATVLKLAGLVTVSEPQVVGLDDLNITPLDFLYLSGTVPGAITGSLGYNSPRPEDRRAGETEIEQRIKYHVRKQNLLDPNCEIEIDFWEVAAGYEKSMGQALDLARYVYAALSRAVCLAPPNIETPEQGEHNNEEDEEVLPPYGFDFTELRSRVAGALSALTALSTDPRLQPDNDDTDVFFEVCAWGVEGCLPPSPLRDEHPDRKASIRKVILSRIIACGELVNEADEKMSPAEGADPDTENAVKLLIRAMKVLFGGGFITLPVLVPVNADELDQASSQDDILGPADESRIRLWLQQAAQTHRPLHEWETALMVYDAWRSPRVTDETKCDSFQIQNTEAVGLHVLQLPFDNNRRWIALSDEEIYAGLTDRETEARKALLAEEGRERGVLSFVYASPHTVDFTKKIAGLVIDDWSEWIPDPVRRTGVSFQYDSPNNQAPQALLLAVPPKWTGEHTPWTYDTLLDIVNSTIDLAKIRTVDIDAFNSKIGQFFPLAILPPDLANPEWARQTDMPGLEELLSGRVDQHIDFALFPEHTDFSDRSEGIFTFTARGNAEIKEELFGSDKYLRVSKRGIEIQMEQSFDLVELVVGGTTILGLPIGSLRLEITAKNRQGATVLRFHTSVSSSKRKIHLHADNIALIDVSGDDPIPLFEIWARVTP